MESIREVRLALTALLAITLTGCRHSFVLDTSQTSNELQRASLIVIGVIESHHFESETTFRISLPPGTKDEKYWRVLRRRIRVETVLMGSENRKQIDVYEVHWTGGTSGYWNSTHDGERVVLPLRFEDGCYRTVRDWWRSIYVVTSGPHTRMPLDATRPLWERIALMNWWIESDNPAFKLTYPYFRENDTAGTLSLWRIVKLERGLVRHPSPGVRIPACRELLLLGGWGQDECWDALSEDDRQHLHDSGYFCCSQAEVSDWRRQNADRGAGWWWQRYGDREDRRLLTAMNNPRLRRDFCRLYQLEYHGDPDTGCPADRPPPATIVTSQGDVPLEGPWPATH